MDEHLVGRATACLLGGAIGDALGNEIEFLSLRDIRLRFPQGVTLTGTDNAITDDTQMTLFTAEGLIRAMVRHDHRGICAPHCVVHHALLRWFATQGGRPQMRIDREVGLITDMRLHARRAPGNTCLGALGQARRFGDTASNHSKGCGTIMRVAPVALIGADPAGLAMQCSALTHGHPTGQQAAAAWALLLSQVMDGMELEPAVEATLGRFDAETDAAIRAALGAPRDGRPETVERLGGGWVAEEALAIALYAVLAGDGDVTRSLRIAVTHSGDSDSTGAIAGNLLGLLYPETVLSHDWAGRIECRDLIERTGRDLVQAMQGAEDMWDAYPGW